MQFCLRTDLYGITSGMFTYQNGADARDHDALVSDSLPWVLEAGNPYYAWLFGDDALAKSVLGAWMRRESSEVSISRAEILMCDTEVAGGFIALSGVELKRARRADAVALLTGTSDSVRPGLIGRLRNTTGLFSSVGDDEYYLSKMGLHVRFRGRGYGLELLNQFINRGKAGGHACFRLDVHAENVAAVRRYEKFGFQISRRTRTNGGECEYYSMEYRLEGR